MKKFTFIGLTTLALISTQAFALSIPNNELCLELSAADAQSSTTMTLSYSGLKAGHVQFYGESCYVIPAANGLPEANDCNPVSGSGILHENKLEIGLTGLEYQADLGIDNYASISNHISLSLDTLAGTSASETVAYSGGNQQTYSYFATASVTAVTCPAETADTLAEDLKFQKAVRKLDRK